MFISSSGQRCHLPTMYVFQPQVAEDRRDHRALARDVTTRVREARRRLGDAGHRVRRVVATRQQAGARRRAERGRVEVRVEEAAVGDALDVRRLDQAAEGLHRREADVVEDDVEHVRRAVGRHRLRVRLPVRGRLLDVDVDRALERLAHRALLLGSSNRRGPPAVLASMNEGSRFASNQQHDRFLSSLPDEPPQAIGALHPGEMKRGPSGR